MNFTLSACKEAIRQTALNLGAVACGMARADTVSSQDAAIYNQWLSEGCHGEMAYCEKYRDVRHDPRLLLEGARTVICCAFSYYNENCEYPLASRISRYAWGDDYHYVIKSRLNQLADFIIANYGGTCRATVDTAPIRERYWAMRSGIGFTGRNGQFIVPGAGSYCFLGELLWTGEVPPDSPCSLNCASCMACVKACPGKALDGTGRCDARKCISYLTIEHRADLPSKANLSGSIYGCDICQKACPHNRNIPQTTLPEFNPVNPILECGEDELLTIKPSHYKRLIRRSAMQRIPLAQLRRNILHNR